MATRESNVLVLLSLLLAMSLGGCGGCGKEPVDHGKEPTELVDVRSEQAKEYEAKMKRAASGESVDFDGDGHMYRTWTDENGVEYSELNPKR